ncbi:uncharacterized protein LOC122059156 [Macadamia integrifolia]|uniref:uncharacterized protein LOC122059156 n=1 Tax=Macadamia integrifolia TaxID=60698 RepID=UPI001C52D351|nr:uncharacterized protein LOC122059156 [Macadamia integrifolia]
MDPAGFEAVVQPGSSEKSLASVGDKRPAENEDDLDTGGRLHKKARGDSSKDMKKVAEIVLVLSAMGKMRGGRNPTDVEKRLMEEARQKLAEMCEAMAPKDILPKDAVKVVIEDLGLNNGSKDQRLGFRPPKMSIAERLLMTKRKMEEPNRFAGQSGTYSSQSSQVGFSATVESHGTLSQAAHIFPPGKPCPTPVSVGVFQSGPTTVHVSALSSTSSKNHVSALSSTSSKNQLPVNEVQPSVVSRGLSSSSLEKDSSLTLPRTEAAHFRLDGRLNGPAFASQVRGAANTSVDHRSVEAPTFSRQPQPFSVAVFGQTNKGSDHTPIKAEGSSNICSSQVSLQAVKDQSSKASVIQPASGSLPSVHQPSQVFSPFNNYNDIARNVQKFLQPRLPEHPNWTPPSVEYMNKAVTCQICKSTICDVESLLVCDMEEPNRFAGQSGTYSSQSSQVGFSATVESHGTLSQAAYIFPPGKPCPTPVSVGVFQSGPTTVHPQPFSVAVFGQTNKGSDHTPIKAEGSSNICSSQVSLQAVKDQSSKASVIQPASGSLPSVHQPSQVFSPFNNYNDIARNVQKFLQPRLPEHPNWTPPSVEYMNKAVTCQICKATICDVESLLVCDACEKGVHLKCLQSYNQKGIPKGEWHCPKCIISSNGKPLPPKYGRVTRNITAPKVSLNTNGGLISAEKKVEISDQKINNQKAVANGNPGLVNSAGVGSKGSSHVESVPELKISRVRESHGPDFAISEIGPEKSRETPGVVWVPISGKVNYSSNPPIQSSESSACDTGRSESEFKSTPNFDQGHHCREKRSVADIDSSYLSQASRNSLDATKKGPLNHEASGSQDIVNIFTHKELEKSNLRDTTECNSGCEIRQENQDFAQADSIKASNVGNGARDWNISPFDDLHGVDWVGDVSRTVDEKSFYQSCRVDGVVYKLKDHALFYSSNGSLRPSKLQVLWEDNKTRKKWAIVNRCYLPGDLPEVVGRPCTPEINEVYESNHDSTVLTGLIQGPCQVLPPNKFKEESERRNHLPHGAKDGLQPVFLCKWFYDQSKGLFRAVTD